MKKLMDLYTSHIEQFMGRKENLKTTSRVILANNGRFEGITTDIENKPVSFIFGNVFEDGIEKPEYNECMFEIIRYISGERPTFPLISDFYY